jgi:KaiC/GvpD/RAD55 family RecA-like ATPase
MPDTKSIYLKTGDRNLDRILAMDAPDERSKGIRHVISSGRIGAPVVLILGAAGTGKTTLALQIASAVAGEPGIDVFFYSLEQSAGSLKSAFDEFGFAYLTDPPNLNPFTDFADKETTSISPGRINLCHFAPLPIMEMESERAFDDRFKQLCHLLSEVTKPAAENGQKPPCVFFLDSLNALSNSALQRGDVYRLFAVFRSQRIPVIVTAERAESGIPGNALTESARFLADVVIELIKDDSNDHLLQYLEITKSRIRRQALGRHLYKIRTITRLDSDRNSRGYSDRKQPLGFTVYPSIPCILSMVKDEPRLQAKEFPVCKCPPTKERGAFEKDPTGFYHLFRRYHVKSDSRFALLGPYGTHKLAVAMNIAAGLPPDREVDGPKLLIISFGGYESIDLSRVAWLPDRTAWAECRTLPYVPSPKWWTTPFYRCARLGAKAVATDPVWALQLSFRLGHLTPEECFHQIHDVLTGNKTFQAVLLSDTGQICTGFPLLRRDPLFLPALLDLFHKHRLVSVSIGVSSESSLNRDMDFALQSCSDYRIYHAHYPSADSLSESIVKGSDRLAPTKISLDQQLVSVVVDNVGGKRYNRTPSWLGIVEPTGVKRLFCGSFEGLCEVLGPSHG